MAAKTQGKTARKPTGGLDELMHRISGGLVEKHGITLATFEAYAKEHGFLQLMTASTGEGEEKSSRIDYITPTGNIFHAYLANDEIGMLETAESEQIERLVGLIEQQQAQQSLMDLLGHIKHGHEPDQDDDGLGDLPPDIPPIRAAMMGQVPTLNYVQFEEDLRAMLKDGKGGDVIQRLADKYHLDRPTVKALAFPFLYGANAQQFGKATK